MSLSSGWPIPAEVVELILQHLSRNDMLSLIRVGTWWYTRIAPYLYSHLVLPTNVRNWPSLVDRPMPPGPFGPPHKKQRRRRILQRNWLKDQVRLLDVYPHTIHACYPNWRDTAISTVNPHQLPPLPNIKALRVWLSSARGNVHYHVNKDDIPDKCAALSNIRPRTLIVRDYPIFHNTSPLLSLPDSVEQYIRRCILVVRGQSWIRVRDNDTQHSLKRMTALDGIPRNTTEVVIVLLSEEPSAGQNRHGFYWKPSLRGLRQTNEHRKEITTWHLDTLNPDSRPPEDILAATKRLAKTWTGDIVQAMAAKFLEEAGDNGDGWDLTIVNAESLYPTPPPRDGEAWGSRNMEQQVKWLFTERMYQQVDDDEERDILLERVQFLSMRDYLQLGDRQWEGVLDGPEMRGW